MNESEKSVIREQIGNSTDPRLDVWFASVSLGEKGVKGSDVNTCFAGLKGGARRGQARRPPWEAPAHQEGCEGPEGLLGPWPFGGLCPAALDRTGQCPGLTETRPWVGKDWMEWTPRDP